MVSIELTKDNFFCGTIGRHEDTMGPLSGFRGTVYEPKSTCSDIYIKLKDDLYKANKKIEVPDEKTLRENSGSMSSEQLRIRLNEWSELKNAKKEQDKIIANWKQIIWNKFLGKIIEQKRFFGGIEKSEDLNDEQVISFTNNLLVNLENIANRNGDYFVYFVDWDEKPKEEFLARILKKNKEQHCPLAPKEDRFGAVS